MQRALKFVKYLPSFGWKPVVLTVNEGNYPSIDESLKLQIPTSVKVYKTKSFEPFGLYKSLSGRSGEEKIPTFVLNKTKDESLIEKFSKWLRANVFIPDAKIGWAHYIVNEGMKIVEREKPDLIFSSSPPHSLQIGAMRLAKKSKIKWIADFRDPWIDAFWQKDVPRLKTAVKSDAELEMSVLSSADRIVTVSKNIAASFQNKINKVCHYIPNGFDEDDFHIEKTTNKKFTISYTGSLGESQRIDNFLAALTGLSGDAKSNLTVNFYGSFHPDIYEAINKHKQQALINFYGNISHDENIKVITNSDVLLLVIPDAPGNNGILTGKLFEYLAARNYILGIGPKNGEAAAILSETKCGCMFDYKDDITDTLNKLYREWKENKKFEVNSDSIIKYSRKYLTGELVRVFEELK